MTEFLWEIGCEEIPARMLPMAIRELKSRFLSAVKENHLATPELTVECQGTPRRLVIMARHLAERQPDVEETRRGPSVKAAFDGDGKPTRAAQGFAKSCGVEVDALEKLETPKGSYLSYTMRIPGRSAEEVLAECVVDLVRSLPWPKTMRWGTGDFRFVRPLHSMTTLYNGKLIPLTLQDDALPKEEQISSSDTISGHRFLGPGPFQVTGIDSYLQAMEKGRIILDLDERKRMIREKSEALAVAESGTAVIDDALLTENASLVEWPEPLLGRFDEAYLDVPPEVLVTSMKSHQKYFPVVDENGTLKPCFVLVSNMTVSDPDVLIRGNERVLRARLEDAAFYWNEDRKTPLSDRRKNLEGVVFQAKLGTVAQKSQRMERLSAWLADKAGMGVDSEIVVRGAQLAKCDLVSGMVGEFAELQGIMGSYYALDSGEPKAVARAIREHYQPQGANDDLPESPEGRVLALADRIDTLVGCFGISLEPTGNKDPFALRRAALGVLRMLLDGDGVRLSLRELLGHAYDSFDPGVLDRDRDTTVGRVIEFFYGRLKALLKAQGVDHDPIASVQALGSDDMFDVVRRINALAAFKSHADYISLVSANKRIANILAKSAGNEETGGSVSTDLFADQAEKALYAALTQRTESVTRHAGSGNYEAALTDLAALRAPIDRFFDDVMVMADDPAIRANRLALMAILRGLFNQVADISQLVLPER
ncbi:MAG: glycine--tRNA ligase subunit beta [Magnetococcales bacterium]|nr:glycine--tRNA ligase subunit beta [Magnetococcales bacterium]